MSLIFFCGSVFNATENVLSYLVVLLQLGFFAMNSKKILNLHTTLFDVFEKDQAQRTKSTLLCSVYKFSIPAYVQIVSNGFASVALASPIFYILRQLIHFQMPNTNYTLHHSYGHGYPWTIPKGYIYHVHFLFEMAQSSIIFITATSIDCAFSFYAYLLCSNLRALSVRLTNPQSEEKFLDLINTCLKKHIVLKECRNCMERIFGPVALLHIVTNSVQLCAFIISLDEMSLVSIIFILTFAIGKLLQTFMYSWYGTCIISSSEELREAVYFSKWQNTTALDVHVKTSVTMTLMQKPMFVHALVTILNLETFCAIINTAMLYFCLLRSLET